MFCFQPESNIPEEHDYEKYQHYTDVLREVQATRHSTTTAIASKVALIDILVRIEVYADILFFKCYLQTRSCFLVHAIRISAILRWDRKSYLTNAILPRTPSNVIV